MDMHGMMNSLFDALGASNNTNHQSTEQILAKMREEENVQKYDNYAHNIFCVLFVALLVFLPYEYDVNLFGYSLSSDAWTFCISLEIILFSIFYGYKQYLQSKHTQNQ